MCLLTFFFFFTALNSPLEEPVLGSTVKYNELCDLKMCKLMSSQNDLGKVCLFNSIAAYQKFKVLITSFPPDKAMILALLRARSNNPTM